jgi:serine beta-lactamase-like protein LACTB
MTTIRRSASFLLCIAFCMITLFSFARAQLATTANYAAEIDHLTSEALQKQRIPAMTVAVAIDGHVIYSKGLGTADIEHAVVANNDTLIRTGSLAKPITAVAAMTLVESGKLDLNAPVQKYCPAFPQKEWTITTRELLAHTAGIRHYKENEVENTKHYKNMSDGFAVFAADPLLFQPGTKFSYSTYGYTVVGCVIEGASGEKFFDYVREHVLVPSNMTHTFVDDVYLIIPNRARGYQVHDGKVENAGLMDSSYKIPGGGLVSTAEDFVRFGSALMDGKILKSETLRLLWSPTGVPTLNGGKPSPYALGFGVLTAEGQQVVTHGGGQQGTSTEFVFLPSKHFAVAVFANDEDADPESIVNSILDLYRIPKAQE